MFTKADIEKYFMAEKQESLLFLLIGIMAILLAAGLVIFLKTNFVKGLAIPLVVVGLLQAVAGFTVYKRSDEQRIDNVYAFDMNPGKLNNEELPRMKVVNKNFVIYRWVEIACILTGLTLIVLYKSNLDKTLLYGLGISLALQAAIMLGADYFAEKRALVYTGQLEGLVQKR